VSHRCRETSLASQPEQPLMTVTPCDAEGGTYAIYVGFVFVFLLTSTPCDANTRVDSHLPETSPSWRWWGAAGVVVAGALPVSLPVSLPGYAAACVHPQPEKEGGGGGGSQRKGESKGGGGVRGLRSLGELPPRV
jgi:hypothetical protein